MDNPLFTAKDEAMAVKAAYYQGRASYDEMAAAATRYLTLIREAEIRRFGKAKTVINAKAIAAFLR